MFASAVLLALVVFSLGCSEPNGAILRGRVGDGPAPDAPALVDAEVEIVDRDTGETLLIGPVGAEGRFDFFLPSGRSIMALVRSPDTVTTAFAGQTGFIDVTLEDGTIYGLSTSEIAQWRSDFEGCPGVEAATVALGRMEFSNLEGEELGKSPIASDGQAEVIGNGDPILACYLDDKGVYDPLRARTGGTGRFAIFDLPAGNSTLDVVFEWAPKQFDSPGPIPVWMPDSAEEVVVPYLPLRLEFPFPLPI